MSNTLIKKIEHLNPCYDAAHWLASYEDVNQAWNDCKRGDWMLWLLGRLVKEQGNDEHKRLVFTCCQCTRLALPYTKDDKALKCIEIVERWTRDEASIDEVRAARKNAYAAADAAAASAAAYAAAYAYAADAAAAARQQTLQACADIVRKYHPTSPIS